MIVNDDLACNYDIKVVIEGRFIALGVSFISNESVFHF